MGNIKDIKDGINKLFGKNTLMTAGDYDKFDGKVIPSGSIGIDIASGIGGFPCGKIVEIFGMESSGKTTIALQAIAQCQKMGLIGAIVDAEHALDLIYAEALGIDIDELLINQPDNGEQAFEIVEKLIDSKVSIIVVDSVAALTPKAEIEGNYGDSKMGLHARLMSQAMRKLTAKVSKSNTCLIFINQIRLKIGVLFGNPETTTGGNALKFYASMRLEVRRKESPNAENKNVDPHSVDVKVKFVKNKCAPPFRRCTFEIEYGAGTDTLKELIQYATDAEILKKSGSWFAYNEQKIAQGKEELKTFLLHDPEITNEIYEKLLAFHNI